MLIVLDLPDDARSLPTRERGLKLDEGQRYIAQNMSLPTRERGLKQLR